MASRKFTWLLILYMLGAKGLAAEDPAQAIVFRFGGYIQAEFFSDSRRMLSAREGSVPLYPDRVLEDPDGNDLNAVRSTTFSLLSSRMHAGMLVTQSDFASPGPAGTGSGYIRNSGKPEVFGQAILQWPDFLAGGSAGYLSLRHRTTTENGFQTRETMGSLSGRETSPAENTRLLAAIRYGF